MIYSIEPIFEDILCGSYFSRILNTPPVFFDEYIKNEIHMLLCKRDIINALWCLKSFYRFSSYFAQLVLHADGTLEEQEIELLKEHFPKAKIILRIDSDRIMKDSLYKYPNCFKYRFNPNKKLYVLSLKLLDFFYFTNDSFLSLDTDLLFFKYPEVMLYQIKNKKGFFMSDCRSSYSTTKENMKNNLNIDMLDKVNAGLLYIPSKDIFDIEFLEYFLGKLGNLSEEQTWWIEQTFYAVLFSKNCERFIRLEQEYQISKLEDDYILSPVNENTVSHHYAARRVKSISYFREIRNLWKNEFGRE